MSTFRFPVYIASSGAKATGLSLSFVASSGVGSYAYSGVAPTVALTSANAPAITETVAASGIYQFSVDMHATRGIFGYVDLGSANTDANGNRYHWVDCADPVTVKSCEVWEWAGGASSISTPVNGAGTMVANKSDVIVAGTNTWSITDNGDTHVQTKLT